MSKKAKTAQELNRELIKQSNCRVVVSGDITEVYRYERPFFFNWPYRCREVGQSYKSNRKREDNLLVAQRYLRRLIFANKNVWSEQIGFLTFTFEDNVDDLKKANIFWRSFMRRLDLKYSKKIKYTAVVEFQERGAVHYHVLFYNLPERILKEEIRCCQIRKRKKSSEPIGPVGKVWGYGFVDAKTIKKIRSLRSVGAYVSKYLTKNALDERLRGQKVYFSSRGLIKPMEYLSEKYQKDILQGIDKLSEVKYTKKYQSDKYGLIEYIQYETVKY